MTLKTLTVRYLRELARKHLGRGHSKLKTKAELLAALRKYVPGMADGDERPQQERSSEVQMGVGKGSPQAPAQSPPRSPAPVQQAPQAAPVGQLKEPARPNVAIRPPPPPPTPREPVPAEPLIEGFFVARVQGANEARRHHLTEEPTWPRPEASVAFDPAEHLGPLPSGYQDDRVVLLARDPAGALLYWDFSAARREAAFAGMWGGRALLSVRKGFEEVRTIELALEARSYYVHGLSPGHTYRMELYAVAPDGKRRLLGSSNPVTLPRDDVSSDTSVRFMRVDFDAPLHRLKEHLHTGRAQVQSPLPTPEPLEIVHHRWVPLPNSGSWQLQTWVEQVPQGQRPGPGQQVGAHQDFGPFPVGGSSSPSLQGGSPWNGAHWAGSGPAAAQWGSSDWSSPGGAPWSFLGASRAPLREG
jgi:hypothetical protein